MVGEANVREVGKNFSLLARGKLRMILLR